MAYPALSSEARAGPALELAPLLHVLLPSFVTHTLHYNSSCTCLFLSATL